MRRLLVADLAATSQSSALQPEYEAELVRATPPDWEVRVVRSPTSSDGDGPPRPSDESMAAVERAEVYFGFGMPRPLFLEAKTLRWIHSAAAGVGSLMYEELCTSDVVVTNSAGIHAVPIAEYAVAGILYFLRGLDIALDQQRRREWNKQPFDRTDSVLREMDSVRALVVGTGGLGGAIGTRLTALGAVCTGVRRRVDLGPPAGFARVISLRDLDAALPEHDVIVLAAPLTPDTDRLLTAERLDRLPTSAIIVNVSRGALMDEEALAARVESGRLRGAVLDVFQREPLASSSPLWQLRSVLLTPHISPVSPGRFWPRQMELVLDNWRRYRANEPLRNVVDKEAGY
jgi:glyoxylate/hydroxypyruvate reductase